MDIDQARTFLAIAAHRSFLEAARRLHVTQSTVSARIQILASSLGAQLLVRNRAGATPTVAGRRFMQHAKTPVMTVEQARHDVGLPRRSAPDISVDVLACIPARMDGRFPRTTRPPVCTHQ